MKNWRSETMPSQDCSFKLSGIRKMTCPASRHPSPTKHDLLLKNKLGRRPSFKMTSPTLRSQIHKQYVFMGSQIRWRIGVQKQCYRKTVTSVAEGFQNDMSSLETTPSQDCSLHRRGIWKWHFQCPATQVQQQSKLLLKLKLGRKSPAAKWQVRGYKV